MASLPAAEKLGVVLPDHREALTPGHTRLAWPQDNKLASREQLGSVPAHSLGQHIGRHVQNAHRAPHLSGDPRHVAPHRGFDVCRRHSPARRRPLEQAGLAVTRGEAITGSQPSITRPLPQRSALRATSGQRRAAPGSQPVRSGSSANGPDRKGHNSTSPSTRSGCVAANTTAPGAVEPAAKTCARRRPTASITVTMSPACSSSVGRRSTDSDSPMPRI